MKRIDYLPPWPYTFTVNTNTCHAFMYLNLALTWRVREFPAVLGGGGGEGGGGGDDRVVSLF